MEKKVKTGKARQRERSAMPLRVPIRPILRCAIWRARSRFTSRATASRRSKRWREPRRSPRSGLTEITAARAHLQFELHRYEDACRELRAAGQAACRRSGSTLESRPMLAEPGPLCRGRGKLPASAGAGRKAIGDATGDRGLPAASQRTSRSAGGIRCRAGACAGLRSGHVRQSSGAADGLGVRRCGGYSISGFSNATPRRKMRWST